MHSLQQALQDTIDNRIGDSRSKSSTVRCVLWTGKMLTDDNSVEVCPGYDRLRSSVWVCPKDRYLAFVKGRWRPETLDVEIARIRARVGLGDHEAATKEHKARRSPGHPPDPVDIEPKDGGHVGLPIADTRSDNDLGRLPTNTLWQELAFYEMEVRRVELSPNDEKSIPGGIISPGTVEVIVTLSQSAKFDPVGAKFILNPAVDRMVLNMVPRGGGVKAQDYNRQVRASIGRNNSINTTARVTRAIENIDWKYRARCSIEDPEVALEGDLWHEGVRSSITRGLFEIWTDDLRMGPMLRVSRGKVHEAAARYTRQTAAAENRYATERDHPASADLASNALTPIPVYIEDWFGDPNFYFGLATFLIQLAQGFDDKEDSNTINRSTVDLGVFDYGQIYNKYEGVEV